MITFETTQMRMNAPRFVFDGGITIGRLRFTTRSAIFTPNNVGLTRGFRYIKAENMIVLRDALEEAK